MTADYGSKGESRGCTVRSAWRLHVKSCYVYACCLVALSDSTWCQKWNFPSSLQLLQWNHLDELSELEELIFTREQTFHLKLLSLQLKETTKHELQESKSAESVIPRGSRPDLNTDQGTQQSKLRDSQRTSFQATGRIELWLLQPADAPLERITAQLWTTDASSAIKWDFPYHMQECACKNSQPSFGNCG